MLGSGRIQPLSYRVFIVEGSRALLLQRQHHHVTMISLGFMVVSLSRPSQKTLAKSRHSERLLSITYKPRKLSQKRFVFVDT